MAWWLGVWALALLMMRTMKNEDATSLRMGLTGVDEPLMLGFCGGGAYDPDHIQQDLSPAGWDAFADSQPALALVPQALGQASTFVESAAGATIFRVGDPVRMVFFVLSGEVRLIRHALNGSEVILQRSRSGFIAEASLHSPAYHCDALSVAPSTLLGFPVIAFGRALDEDATFRKAWQSLLAREVRKLRAQCERLSLHNAADRIVHYIEAEGMEGAIVMGQPRKAWAAELGLTHEALYRALRRMQDEGVLLVDGSRIAILR